MHVKTDLGDVNQFVHSEISDFVILLKPRVMSLVVFSAIAGLWVAPGSIHWFQAVVVTCCVALGSGAAGAMNMWYERDIDALMKRTRDRPLPAGRVAPSEALTFAIVIAGLSVVLMGFSAGYMAAGLLLLAIIFYVFIYTIWLKRKTVQNIVIGGAAGAFPPMIGWAAVTGTIDWASISLFMFIFVWTPAHFWPLSLYCNEDYKRANIPMLPVIRGDRSTRIHIVFYSLLLVPVSLLPAFFDVAGKIYGISAFVLSIIFVGFSLLVLNEMPKKYYTRMLFKFSIFYLFILFTIMMFDRTSGVSFENGL
ncbi:MAG: heme o synthase [Pseudomonadota bacterium]